MKPPLTFLLAILLTSCVTERKRNRICATCPQIIERHDSTVIRESISRDTTYVPMMDSAFYQLYLKCIDGRVVIDKELKQLGRMINLSYTLEGNMLRIQSDVQDSLMHIIERLTKEINTVKTETKTPIIMPQPEPSIKWWQWPLIVLLWSVCAIAIVAGGILTYKFVKK
jgi:hypothetical protein